MAKEYFKGIFLEKEVRSSAFIDVDKLINNWDEILVNKNGAGLFRFICLELWMRKFNVKANV